MRKNKPYSNLCYVSRSCFCLHKVLAMQNGSFTPPYDDGPVILSPPQKGSGALRQTGFTPRRNESAQSLRFSMAAEPMEVDKRKYFISLLNKLPQVHGHKPKQICELGRSEDGVLIIGVSSYDYDKRFMTTRGPVHAIGSKQAYRQVFGEAPDKKIQTLMSFGHDKFGGHQADTHAEKPWLFFALKKLSQAENGDTVELVMNQYPQSQCARCYKIVTRTLAQYLKKIEEETGKKLNLNLYEYYAKAHRQDRANYEGPENQNPKKIQSKPKEMSPIMKKFLYPPK